MAENTNTAIATTAAPTDTAGAAAPSNNLEPARSETHESADDAALDRIVGSDQESDGAGAAQASEPAKAAAVAETTDAGDAAAAAGDGKGGEAEAANAEAADNKVEPAGFKDALQVLMRGKVPASVIENLNPDEAIAWAKELKEIQAGQDRLGAEKARLEQENATLKKAPADKTDTAAKPLEPVVVDDPKMAEHFDLVEQTYGKDVADPMRSMHSTMTSLRAVNDAMSKDVDRLYEQVETMLVDGARSVLTAKYPKLSDDATFTTVHAEATKLFVAGAAKSVKDAMAAACAIQFADQKLSDYQQQQKTLTQARNAGTPRLPKTASLPAATPTLDQQEDAALDAILEGKGREAARNAFEKAGQT